MDQNEYEFVKHWISSRRVPTPRILIKDHKTRQDDGNFPTRLLVPATGFTQCFSKISYLAIKRVFDLNNVKYAKKTIVQSSHLKCQLEGLNLKAGGCTIASLDIVNMYPSVKFKLIKQAIEHYSKGFTEEEQTIIEASLEMLKFSMGNTIIQFRDKYYEYGVHEDAAERPLAIGSLDAAFNADMVADYLLEMAEDHFDMTHFFGQYRDDGQIVFEGERSVEDLEQWLYRFQDRINNVVGEETIQFTMEVWKPGQESQKISPKMKVVGGNEFPYLDIKMSYDAENSIYFGAYSKPEYQTKYLDSGSCHTRMCKKAIPRGVAIRLSGLTTRTPENENESLSDLYPKTHKALAAARLIKGDDKLPKLGRILDERDIELLESQAKREEWSKDKRNTYVIMEYEGNWRVPVRKTIDRLKEKYGLSWLRHRMV